MMMVDGVTTDLGKTDAITVAANWAGKDVQISAYERLADAIQGATAIDLPNATTDSYKLLVTTKASSATNGTLVYGAVDHATNATAAQALEFTSYAPISGTEQNVSGINSGSYIVVALENNGDIAYYAYVIK